MLKEQNDFEKDFVIDVILFEPIGWDSIWLTDIVVYFVVDTGLSILSNKVK